MGILGGLGKIAGGILGAGKATGAAAGMGGGGSAAPFDPGMTRETPGTTIKRGLSGVLAGMAGPRAPSVSPVNTAATKTFGGAPRRKKPGIMRTMGGRR